ncbi:EcsC family protein [Faecalitalea cylindroides]
MLYLKFIQGIPIVGAISGFYDSKYMNQISKYANLKYQLRFLKNKL